MNFASDNQSGASKKVMQALVAANEGVASSYATDTWTLQAEERLAEVFECDLKAFFVSSGTAANSLALSSLVQPWDTVLCHGQAHILNDELTAVEFFSGGARLHGLDLCEPRLRVETLSSYLSIFEGHTPHTSQPAALSLTQLTESGQCYSLSELRALSAKAKEQGMKVHMDGARFANALLALNASPADMTWRSGVDVLCLGASKDGCLAAEAVIFFDLSLAENFEYRRKRAGHLLSKGRLLGAQLLAWLEDDHWLDLARRANEQGRKLAEIIEQSRHARVAWKSDANEVFAVIDRERIRHLRDQGAAFHEWPRRFAPADMKLRPHEDLVRLVASFNTSDSELRAFKQNLG